MNDLVHTYPTIWFAIGTAVAGIIFYVANRKVFAMQQEATMNLIITYKEQIAAITVERNTYRENLHLEKQGHTAAQLKLKEVESRPDLSTIQEVMQQVVTSLSSVADKLTSRDPVFDRIEKGFETTTKVLAKVVDHFDAVERRVHKRV
jgi:vacuolar-type H+-ATPase subunit E/Vma4